MPNARRCVARVAHREVGGIHSSNLSARADSNEYGRSIAFSFGKCAGVLFSDRSTGRSGLFPVWKDISKREPLKALVEKYL
jgi:hypothetical protein